MTKEFEIWKFALDKLQKFGEVVLLVVAESAGSSPGRKGFKMILSKDEFWGSIGGGLMEVNLVNQFQKHPQTLIIDQVHRKNAANSSGMICSGQQTVIAKPLAKDEYETVKRIVKNLQNQIPFVLRITEREFQIIENKKFSSEINFIRSENNKFEYREKINPEQNLFIIGGGHCALALSEIMAKLGFQITLFDDRPNLNTIKKNNFANKKTIIQSYELIDKFIPSGKGNYVVVMTLGYKFDEIVIKKLITKNFKYFGVLGSQAKMRTLLNSLEKQGFDRNSLDTIHTPIGLPINSHTPEEIAVSIAAEIIMVKNQNKRVN